MKPDRTPPILLWLRLPLRLSSEELAQLTNFRDKDAVGVLVRSKMWKPLGNPPPRAPMWFLTSEILELCNNRAWMDKATRIVREYVKIKNNKSG